MAKKKKTARIWISIIILLIAAIVVVYFVSSKSNGMLNVITTKVEKRTITQTVSAIGKIEAETEVKVSSQTSGEINFLGVKEGDTVKQGQLLVRIKPDVIDAQLKQMEASAEASKMDIAVRKTEVERAKLDLDRMTELLKKEFVSQKEFDVANSAYESAVSSYKGAIARYDQSMASLQQVQREQERTAIYAPVSGVITALNIEMGEKVVGTGMMAGTELMRVSDLRVMNAVVDVDENDIVMVKLGDTTTIEVDAIPDKKFRGIVVELGHSAIAASAGTQDQVVNFKVKVRFIDNEFQLRPGMSCNVEINTETRFNVIAVPLQAVTVRENKELSANKDFKDMAPKSVKEDDKKLKVERPPSVIFLYNNGIAKMVKVETGISDKGYIEIKSGISENDQIISGSFMAVSKELADGSKVKIDTISKSKFQKK
jgi:HlyD family secretion protein